MDIKRWPYRLVVILLILVGGVLSVQAQSDPACPYAQIRLDTDQAVDTGEICQAAQPWAEDGFQVLVLLTDYRPADEAAWFAYLDQVEIEAGLRNASQPDQFQRMGIAFEAITASDLPWAYSVTIGESLYGSALDTDAALGRVKGRMRAGVAAGNPTEGLVDGLTTAHQIYRPAAAPQAAEPQPVSPTQAPTAVQPPVEQPSTSEETQASGSSFPWGWLILGVAGLAVVGGGGYLLAVQVVMPAIRRRRRRQEMTAHLETLRSRTSNLLNACEPLLRGESPQETVLYQLFGAYGGEQSQALQEDVFEWLRRSREALDDAFDLRQKLVAPDVAEKRSLEQLVDDWEMLYLTFVGSSERILSLTDSELRTLLDPVLILDREQADVQLAQQLDAIRRELAGEDMPFKVELMQVDPAQTDAEGILGYLDQVKATIAYLQEARRQAPERLAEAQAERQAAKGEVPDPFVMTEKQLFAGIDGLLEQAEQSLHKDLFLHSLDQTADAVQDIETVRAFVAAVAKRDQRQAAVEAITAQGYRPPHLEEDLKEIEGDVQEIVQAITAGDYPEAAPWIKELTADGQRALSDAQAWRTLHEQNTAKLNQVRERVKSLQTYQTEESEPAWTKLQSYPKENWQEVAEGREWAAQTLQSLRDQGLSEIERLNSLDVQKLEEAETILAQTSADLTQAKGNLQALVNRLAEVQAAEAQIDEALRLTEADLEKARAFRDEQDAKIGPQVDEQIEQAQRLLTDAQQAAQARQFVAAVADQTAARQMALTAHQSASEQVAQINRLQQELEETARQVVANVEQSQAKAGALPAPAQSSGTDDLVRQVVDGLSQAQQARTAAAGLEDQALVEALSAAVEQYQELGHLADRTINRIRSDRHAYTRLMNEARQALNSAQAAIQQAEWAVREADAQGAGRHALNRAKSHLPRLGPALDTPKSALKRIRQRADEARRYAEQARGQARRKAQAVQAERRHRRQSSSGGWSWSPGSSISSSSSSSGSSSRRSSWGSSSRRSSFGSSSRRSSSSFGNSRRR